MLLQILSLITLFFFVTTFNILALWYLAGLYLILLGVWLFLDDGDIFVGFLWVIDLGVGLVFFIFILHYSVFLQHKTPLDKSSKELTLFVTLISFLLLLFFFLVQPVDAVFLSGFKKTWFFLLTWYDYYELFISHVITDLNLLREIYFYTNSCEFYMINFVLFYGIISSILLCFFIKRLFSFLNWTQFFNYKMVHQVNATYFIRNQDFLKQQSTSTGTRVWLKKKNLTKYDN